VRGSLEILHHDSPRVYRAPYTRLRNRRMPASQRS
jgi:hypothetical protein